MQLADPHLLALSVQQPLPNRLQVAELSDVCHAHRADCHTHRGGALLRVLKQNVSTCAAAAQ
jgi:hypothetical protein